MSKKVSAANRQLFAAASEGYLEGVKAALAQGASLTAQDDADFTPLARATRDGRAEVVLSLPGAGSRGHQRRPLGSEHVG